jgi:hypothetical protein
MGGYTVVKLTHLHGHSIVRKTLDNVLCAVGWSEGSQMERLPDLSGIHVEGRDRLNIGWTVAREIVMHESKYFFLRSLTVMLNSLKEGTSAISHTRYRNSNGFHCILLKMNSRTNDLEYLIPGPHSSNPKHFDFLTTAQS